MSGWPALDAELDRWGDAGRTATFWWRDDDAGDAVPALEPLLSLSTATTTPVSLAAVPALATAALAARLAGAPTITVLQHGYAHRNHAEPPAKKCEFGPERPAQISVAELAMGWATSERLFGARALPVLVPPWNRIYPTLVPMLPEMKFIGISTFGPRRRAAPVRGIRQVNTHADPVDWKGTRGFAGEEAALAAVLGHLSARREGRADAAEATGILTHHLVHGSDVWDFMARLIDATRRHPAARWAGADELFTEAE